jgi:hypothetical protein
LYGISILLLKYYMGSQFFFFGITWISFDKSSLMTQTKQLLTRIMVKGSATLTGYGIA